MTDLLTLSIAIGLATSLLFTEVFGIAAGGMIVPGYIALSLHRPTDVLVTVGVGFATFGIVHALSTTAIVYGRRRTALMILVGFLLGIFARWLLGRSFGGHEVVVIGYIIPGLVAIWLDRQGVVETLASLVTASVVVRLVLVLLVGTDLPS